jgi:hypothetical protein
MNVGAEGHGDPACQFAQGLRRLRIGGGKTKKAAAHFGQAFYTAYKSRPRFAFKGLRRELFFPHGLYDDGIPAANTNLADFNRLLFRFTG